MNNRRIWLLKQRLGTRILSPLGGAVALHQPFHEFVVGGAGATAGGSSLRLLLG
jgi:hypothetical protein